MEPEEERHHHSGQTPEQDSLEKGHHHMLRCSLLGRLLSLPGSLLLLRHLLGLRSLRHNS